MLMRAFARDAKITGMIHLLAEKGNRFEKMIGYGDNY
jgi:hypothetical protein